MSMGSNQYKSHRQVPQINTGETQEDGRNTRGRMKHKRTGETQEDG
jgi:hypothetical protein